MDLVTTFWPLRDHESHVRFLPVNLSYLLKLLRDQGMSRTHLNTVFRAIILAKITYALPTWTGFLTVEQIGRSEERRVGKECRSRRHNHGSQVQISKFQGFWCHWGGQNSHNRRIRDQGMPRTHLNTVFRAIILAKITYTLPAWRGFLTVEQIGRINSFLKRAFIYGLCSQLFSFLDLADDADQTLFNSML